MPNYGATDKVRRSAAEQYINPARQRGDKTVTIHSGTFGKMLVEQELLPPNRFPLICNALQSKRFSIENHVTLEKVSGPPSGKSSTVTFVYRIDPMSELPQPHIPATKQVGMSLFEQLRGILKPVYKKLGGAEAFHKAERESWD
jgi:hypothetical protein